VMHLILYIPLTGHRAVTGLLTGYNTLIFTQWACQTVHCVGGVEQRMKPRPTLSVSVQLWLHSDMCI
jgi:hypothetical protein